MTFSFCQLEATYCDDIRTEDNGKKILIGVYNGTLLVPIFPAALTRLVISLRLLMSQDRLPKESLRFVLQQDDEVILDQAPPMSMLKEAFDASASMNEDGAILTFAAEFNLAPFAIENAFILRVRAYIDEVEYRAGGLRVSTPDSIGIPASANA